MMNTFLTFTGTTLVLVIFTAALTFWIRFCWEWSGRFHMRSDKPDTLSEQERKRLREEQEAFQRLQNYSAADAYGLNLHAAETERM